MAGENDHGIGTRNRRSRWTAHRQGAGHKNSQPQDLKRFRDWPNITRTARAQRIPNSPPRHLPATDRRYGERGGDLKRPHSAKGSALVRNPTASSGNAATVTTMPTANVQPLMGNAFGLKTGS